MNNLIIPLLRQAGTLSDLSLIMDKLDRHTIGFSPWPDFPYKPSVEFAIAHSGQSVFLKFYVTEKQVQAFNLDMNGPVYQDSCVEFFISWGDDKSYYNLEFSCSGTCNFGYGRHREKRELISKELIRMVRYQSAFTSVSTASPYQVHWELCVMIPLEVFSQHSLSSFDAQACKVNFFKCGDLLPEPHYLSWADISYPEPNFHLPEFFGQACFETAGSEKPETIINDI